MTRRSTLLIGWGLLLLGALLGLFLFLSGNANRARQEWKEQAVAEVDRLCADGQWISDQTTAIGARRTQAGHLHGTWLGHRMAVMGDGEWIVFRNHCDKAGGRAGDIFIGKASNGRWYYSSYHFCVGMVAVSIDPQPPDLASFATAYHLREFDGRSDEAIKETWRAGR